MSFRRAEGCQLCQFMLSPSVVSTAVTYMLLLCWYGVKLAALGSEMWYLLCMNAVWCGKNTL
jgi:hypothetical protein